MGQAALDPSLPGPGGFEFLAAFIGYLVLVIGIGVWATRFSSAGMGNYFLAGRSLNKWVVALSAVVSGRSSWLILGLSGLAYTQGASALWASVGYIVVEFLLFWSYAGRLRRFSERHDCITLPDFFAARFEDKGLLRGLLVVVFLIFLPTYVGAQFLAGGKAFSAGLGLGLTEGVLVTAAIVLGYTVLGGFLAVSLTDVMQAAVMVFSLVVLPLVVMTDAGGWDAVTATLSALDPALIDPMALGTGALIGLLGIGLGSPGNPHILVRYMSIKDPNQLRASAVVGTAWNVVMAFGAVMIGLVGRAVLTDPAQLTGADPENLAIDLARSHLHPALFGVVAASIFAAIMSTTDSQLLVAASSVVRDFWQMLVRRGEPLSERAGVMASRWVVVGLVVVSVVLGLHGGDLVFWFVLLAWAGLGASLGPTSILALYWRGTTRAGVVAGIITGVVVVAVWRWQDWFGLYELVPAFILAGVVTVVVSLFTRPPTRADELYRGFFE